MSSALAAIAVDCADPRRLAGFWCAVLGWRVVDEEPDGVSIAPAAGAPLTIDFYRVPEPKRVKNRIHLDVRPATGEGQAAELERLLALGARHTTVGEPGDASWVVLADPEGNEFCLLAARPAASP